MAGVPVAELEHLIGYGSKHLNTVHYHPVNPHILIYNAGATVILEDVSDPHKQEFLRGHDAEVCALDVSANGRLIASGQLGSPFEKGAPAPIYIWDFENRTQYCCLYGLSISVLCIRFSPDNRFLIGTGENQMFMVFDVATGETVYTRRTEAPCNLGVWGATMEPPPGSRYPSYVLCTTFDNTVLVHSMQFEVSKMSYGLSSDAIQLPSAGLQRKHVCGTVMGEYLMTGTSQGDMCVFSLRSKVFRSALPICNNGVTSLTVTGGLLYAAGGDGRVKAMQGSDTHWDVVAETCLEAPVSSLTPSADGAELIAGLRNGKLFRLLASDLTAYPQSAAHTGEVTDVAFGSSSEAVCTVSDAGEVFLFDLSDYVPISTLLSKSPARCVVWDSAQSEILTGYDSGSVVAWPAKRGASSSSPAWHVQAHRGGVTAVRENSTFIVTGGADCKVRFWHRTTRELLAEFSPHRRPVSELAIDHMNANIVHSGSEDKLVVTFDLKQNKQIQQHCAPASNITGLSQRKDSEQEIVSSSLDGRLLFWDVDYPDPTGCLDSPPGGPALRLRCVEVSPVGRYIAAGADDAKLYIFDLATGGCIQACAGHSGAILRCRWSPDQKQIVSTGKDGCVIVWNFFET